MVTTRTNWFTRIKNALVGAMLRIVMIPGSVMLLSWNEYRTIHRTQGLKEGGEIVETVGDPATVRNDLEGQLVHMTGFATTDEVLSDRQFRVSENGITLRRSVEMYQWVESEESETSTSTGGSKTTETTYSYEKQWRRGREDSSEFAEVAGHENPRERFHDRLISAKLVNVGAYELDKELISQVDSYEALPWEENAIAEMSPILRRQTKLEGDFLYWSMDGSQGDAAPDVGDQRIRMEVVRPTDVSFVAKQKDNSFGAFTVSNGEEIQRLYVGKFSSGEVFAKLQEENMMMAWICRGIGLFVCVLGFIFVLSPLAVFADVIPFFGSLTRSFSMFAGLLLGLGTTMVTIGVAWIAVRPLLAVPMLLVAFAAVAYLFRAWMNKRRNQRNDSGQIGQMAPV